MKPTVNFIFDSRSKKKDGSYSIKLSVYYLGKKKFYNTKQSFTRSQWEKIKADKLRDEDLKKAKKELNSLKAKAEKIIDGLSNFSYDLFEEKFDINYTAKTSDVYALFRRRILDLKTSERIGSAMAYENAMNSFSSFRTTVNFLEITNSWLKNYELFSIKKGLSLTTIGIYLRHLRAIYNLAVSLNIVSKDTYPFSNYTIPRSRNIKKALSSTDIKKLFEYVPKNEGAAKALDIWKFSYLINGINISDIANLKHKDIQGDMLIFYRNKTQLTRREDSKPIRAALSNHVKLIIERWGTKDINQSRYIFPICDESMSAVERKTTVKNFNSNISKRLKKIAEDLQINGTVTNLTARHSFATTLKRNGVSNEFTSDALGHSSLKTTENYLDSFEDHKIHDVSRFLTDFK